MNTKEDFQEVIKNRRSIRRYTGEKISSKDLEEIRNALLFAPSGKALYPCDVIQVTDPDLLQKLSVIKPHGGGMLAEAPAAFIIAGDPGVSDVWIEDGSVLATYIMLAATRLGLGSCWVQFRRRTTEDGRSAEEVIREILDLPPGREILCAVAVGRAGEHKPPHDPVPEQEQRIVVR